MFEFIKRLNRKYVFKCIEGYGLKVVNIQIIDGRECLVSATGQIALIIPQ